MENWFEIGIIVKPQGISGELRVLPTTDDPQRFKLLDEVHVRPKEMPGGTADPTIHTYRLIAVRYHKGLVLLTMEGIKDRNAAEKLVGSVLIIPRSKALPLGVDEYFVRDLIGIEVQTEEGLILGEIADVFATGANDVYVVRDATGKSFMIPAIKDVVLAVSLPDGKMTVRLIDGLKELTT